MSLGISSIWRARPRLVRPAGLPRLPNVRSLRSAASTPAAAIASGNGRFEFPTNLNNASRTVTKLESVPKPKEAQDGPVSSSDSGLEKGKENEKDESSHDEGSSQSAKFESNSATDVLPKDWRNTAVSTHNRSPDRDPRLRNKLYREIFESIKDDDPRIDERLESAFVPPVRSYPSALASRLSLNKARKIAKTTLAWDEIWAMHRHEGHFILDKLQWNNIFGLLKSMTPKKSEKGDLAAVKIVLPGNWDFEIGDRSLEFVESGTGLWTRLRASGDHKNSSAIVLRGNRTTLARAADELIQASDKVQVFELGEVAVQDYETTQLWPALESSVDGETPSLTDGNNSLWMHMELAEPRTTKGYEELVKPSHWNVQGITSYVTNVIHTRFPAKLDPRIHPRLTNNLEEGAFDRDTVKIQLIMKVLMNPAATPFITAPVLNMALSFMAHRGGHRATADRLFTSAEKRGIPMDTETFNIMLEGYVNKVDYRFFHQFLRKMKARFFQPNARTWLLFLQLVQGNHERRLIVVAMYDLGLFSDPATRRGVARALTSHEAHKAFRGRGTSIQEFMDTLKMRYGEDWCTRETLSYILQEYLLIFGKNLDYSQLEIVFEKQPDDGRAIDMGIVNLILEHCMLTRDWKLAIWALHQAHKRGFTADDRTYDYLVRMGVWTKRPRTLGAVLFHAILDRQVTSQIRWRLSNILGGLHKKPFWRLNQPFVFDQAMLQDMSSRLQTSSRGPWSGMVECVLAECGDMVPAQSLAVSIEQALRLDTFEFKYECRLNKPLAIEMRYPDEPLPNRKISLQYGWSECPSKVSKDHKQSTVEDILREEPSRSLDTRDRIRFFLDREDTSTTFSFTALRPDPIENWEEFSNLLVDSKDDMDTASSILSARHDVLDPQPQEVSHSSDDPTDIPQHTEPSDGFHESWSVPHYDRMESSTIMESIDKLRRRTPKSTSENSPQHPSHKTFFTKQSTPPRYRTSRSSKTLPSHDDASSKTT